MLRMLTILGVFLLLAGCAWSPPAATGTAPAPTLLLVSLDGVHPGMLGRGDTPRLDRLAREGVRAAWMTPSYPTLTFPNHYTMVTGLRPDRHGLVHNTMYAAELGWFRLSDRGAVGSREWWGGEPLWVSAERAGLPTATLFWPGSEAPVGGVRPTRWHAFDDTMGMEARVRRVLAWLAERGPGRPRLATLYFEHPDGAAHAHGPHSRQLRETMRQVDAAIGQLLDGIARQGLAERVNIVVVSDHGMAEVPEGQVVAVEEMVDPADAELVSSGQVVGFRPRAGRIAQAEAALLGAHPHYDCWRKAELPERWHYGNHSRIPPIVCQMHEGWDAIPRAAVARRPAGPRGSHGFDPALPSMRAIFIARGPAFRGGTELPPFDNVHVYPLLARLLGIDPLPGDGDPGVLAPALREPGP
ncbi:ectonucleotide pyrophosphatase/phosphodiesterase [Luteimonas sp. RD2P54]|uniref:Ectonucleotide pyrophosphatase/phosphodiesterase n=1 Tax=Luteimonas endophytica TaxID=3042023 RepID=A0ABT6JAM6_9GAMM|nr:ectonucleotide pyrophosphatase/phosphodiesterase [Luteimonas endophytica]MDH5823872.1 ectonucleotide pyrophosphatase/phosphodiesterase [Luteimonas endophytica]